MLFRHQKSIFFMSCRYQRGPFGKPKRSFEDRNRNHLDIHKSRKLELAMRTDRREQWQPRPKPPDPKILIKERKLPSQVESSLPYDRYDNSSINDIENLGTFYDPKFNPHLHEGRYRVDPEEEPFSSIYADSNESEKEFTKVRNITTPQLWEHVKNLARITEAPEVDRRKPNESIKPLPSGFVPPPESPPDLPYFVQRTRNHLLPVYYKLDSDPEECYTLVGKVAGDLWKLEEDLRVHLESLKERRILTSVQETDGKIQFRGRHIHEIVDWLHSRGF